jgi:cytoskeleton protein RodZ
MSDVSSSPDLVASVPNASAVPAASTAGAMLRQAREANGLHIAALAVSLKVPVNKLEALEADRLDAMHDSVFVRALAASVCRTLHIDPVPVLEKLPRGAVPMLQRDAGINAPFHADSPVTELMRRVHVRHPAVWAVVLLLLAAAIVGFLPELEKGVDWLKGLQRAGASSGAPTTAAVAPTAQQETPGMPGAGAAPDLPMQGVPESLPVRTELTASAPVPMAAASAPAAAAAQPLAAASQAADVAAAGSAMLLFKARSSSWIEVADAKGTVLLRRTLSAGESATASGTPPLQAVVGRADGVEVLVRGKPFDLSALAKENVARFEVK